MVPAALEVTALTFSRTNDNRINAMRKLGYSERQAAFLPALCGGYFIRRQYNAFLWVTSQGKSRRRAPARVRNCRLQSSQRRFGGWHSPCKRREEVGVGPRELVNEVISPDVTGAVSEGCPV